MNAHPTCRPPAVAGLFYPADATALARDVSAYLGPSIATPGPVPKALIVPHAGYLYSGATAARAYARLAAARAEVRRVVLLGPAHRVPVRGLALPGVDAFDTPLGRVPIDAEAAAAVQRLPQVCTRTNAHRDEHSLEVQLPFLQTVLEAFALLPFVVGAATAAEVAEVLDHLWGGPETLILVSSDLSHFHDYAEAQRLDRDTAHAILALQAGIAPEQACGATPINGLLHCARQRGLHIELLDLCNSGDTAGDRRRVVGYAAFALTEPDHVRH